MSHMFCRYSVYFVIEPVCGPSTRCRATKCNIEDFAALAISFEICSTKYHSPTVAKNNNAIPLRWQIILRR